MSEQNRRSFDFEKLGMLNTFAAASVILTFLGLVFGMLLSLSIKTPTAVLPNMQLQSSNVDRQIAARLGNVENPDSHRKVADTAVNNSNEVGKNELNLSATYDLLGSWFLNRRNIGGEIKIYEDDENHKLYVDRAEADGERTIRKAWRVDKKILDDHSGEYFVINSDGNLERRNETGLLWTAKE